MLEVRVALTGDFLAADGSPRYPDMGNSMFQGKEWISVWLESHHRRSPGQLWGAGVLTPRSRPGVSRTRTNCSVGRFRVGYDAVDVTACTEADVVAFITAGGDPRWPGDGDLDARPHPQPPRGELVRSDAGMSAPAGWARSCAGGRWGSWARGIARALLRCWVFGMNAIAFDPSSRQGGRASGVRKVDSTSCFHG